MVNKHYPAEFKVDAWRLRAGVHPSGVPSGAAGRAGATAGRQPAGCCRSTAMGVARRRVLLRSSFEFYRALDVTIEQNVRCRERRLGTPVLTIAGAGSVGDGMSTGPIPGMADDLTDVVLPDRGHYPAEEAPEQLLAALTAFLASYR